MLSLAMLTGLVPLSLIDGEWASPVNTGLLVLLALVNLWERRAARRERRTIDQKIEDVKHKVDPDPRPQTARTRRDDR